MRIPAITTDQMREVDRLMIDEYGIKLIQMMENAGRNLAELARQRFLGGDPARKHVVVLAGNGGNGGGGLVAARRLHSWGAKVQVFTTKISHDLVGIPGRQLMILQKLGVKITYSGDITELPKSDLVLDAIIGYSLQGVPKGQAADLIRMACKCEVPILSLDIPSGMNATTGETFVPYIQAEATLSLALPKTGLLIEAARPIVGELYLADISVPPQLYANLGLEIDPIFSEEEIIRV